MAKKWTRNQKLLLAGIIITAIGLIVRIEITFHTIQNDIEELELKTANIETLYADKAEFGTMKTNCPENTVPNQILGPNGIEIICN